jgi:macrolide-specific efflux system membrane fusion protein
LTSLALPRSTRGRRLARSRLPVALAVLAGAAVFGAASTARSASPPATSTSRTATVAQGVVQSTVSGSGNLEPATQQDLSFSTAGEITKVYVAEGDHVSEGQALARLQPTDTSLATTWLRAPVPGTIATIGVAVGDTVSGTTAADTSTGTSSGSATGTTASTGTTPAFTLVQLSQYQMSVSLSESDVGKVKSGQMATVTVSATGEKLAARVTQVGVLASSSSSSSSSSAPSTTSSSSSTAVSYPVTLRLTQTGTGLKPGMTASADIVTGQSTGLTVPTQALHGSTVTVVANGVSTTRRVQTGVAGDSTTEIVSGLKAGDKVLVTSTSAAAGASASASPSGLPSAAGGQRPGGFGAGGGMAPGGAGAIGGGGGPRLGG